MNLVLVLGDQLSRDLSALDGFEPKRDRVLMVEVAEETTYVPHHKQKLAFILSAMRHFAQDLRDDGIAVDYVALTDPENMGSFGSELKRAVQRLRPKRIIVTEPGEWRVRRMMDAWPDELGCPVEIRDDDRFLCSRADFAAWADGRKAYRMEFFYREMRRRSGLLMENDEPVGGRWNFDSENRKSLPKGERPPKRLRIAPDAVTQEVLELVANRFPDHFGELDGFGWAVTRPDALTALDHFIADALPRFGDFQDAMAEDEPFLYHGLISAYLNVGLLQPREVCQAAELAFKKGTVPLNAAEGFIRQILGWREYVRGIYWLEMPRYAQTNVLGAKRKLPWFYWSGETPMNCLSHAIGDTSRHAYAHHIQRLMVTGNFALLAGINPAEIEEWYLAVYVDAFDWVELPNTHGMVMFADGGLLASKPYAASGSYINRMSNYCGSCVYDPKVRTGETACPFNLLYWNFLDENRERLTHNPRMAMPYRNLDRMPEAERAALLTQAQAFLDRMEDPPVPVPAREPQAELFG